MGRPKSGFTGTLRATRAVLSHARVAAHRALWEVDERSLPRVRRAALTVARLVFVTVDSFFRERLQMRAAALAFYSVLSVVPFAALLFSIAKGVGAYELLLRDTVRPYLDQTFEAAPGEEIPEGVEVLRRTLEQVMEMVARTDVSGLGLAGLLVLLVTVQRVVRGAEESFDAIWAFPSQRSFVARLPGYAAVAVITPLALIFASTLTAARHGEPVMKALNRWIPVPFLVDALAFALPPLLVCSGVLLLYVVLPSARVRRRSALIGAIVGGLGWYALQVLHVRFQLGVARTNALYSGFGAVPIFLLWLHLSWVCVLLGAQAAAAHQNAPTLRQLARRSLDDHASRQALALRAMIELTHAQEPIRLRSLAREIGVAVEPLREVLDALAEHALLGRSGGLYDPIYVASTDPDSLRIASVLEAVSREAGEGSSVPWERADEPLSRALRGLQSAAASSAHNRTLGELKRAADEARRGP